MHGSEHGRRTLRRANPKTIQDKVLVGYQGCSKLMHFITRSIICPSFNTPAGHDGWLHWTNGIISQGGRPNVDLWPDTSEYTSSELFPLPGLNMADGKPACVFSSRHPLTVRRHFHWMALHGVDGAFLQRFAGQCDVEKGNGGIRRVRDEIGERVREAAEAEGRVFAIMYDVSGVSPDRIQRVLEQDWIHLLRDQRILDSPNYLRENERPVVALWGFGFNDRNHTPELVRSIGAFFRSNTPGGIYLMAGVPGHWRTSTSDADRNPGFVSMWTEVFDAISPWTVGRYGNEADADRWGEERVKADADYLRRIAEETGKKVDYIPVVLPGGSGYNLSQGKWGLNDIKRNGGRFLWKQIYNARRAGVRTIYGAMWDEYDEGTVFMPVVSRSSQLPVHPDFNFIALDVDGCDLPSDWYMRVAGFAAEGFHGERVLMETFPVKELQDYWSTRPRYEDDGAQMHTSVVGQTYHAWQGAETEGAINDAPPPYSLEDVVRQTQNITLSTGRIGNAALNAPLPSGPPPPVPARNPSISASMSTAASGSLPLSQSIAAHSQSARPAPVNMSSRPIISTQPPLPVKASSRPTSVTTSAHPPSVDLSLRPPSPPTPSTKPHLHHSPDGGPLRMPTPSFTTSMTSSSQAHSPRPTTASPRLVGRPVSPPYNPSAGRLQGPYAAPYFPPGGWGGGHDHSHVDFSAPMPAPENYAYPNQSIPPSMGPHLPHRYGSPPAPPIRHQSHSSYASLPGPSSPPPPVPSRPPNHPQPSGPYAPYAQHSSYGGTTYANYNYNPNDTNNGNSRGGMLAGKALSVVESVAGRDARAQLERKVKSLADRSSLLNKLKTYRIIYQILFRDIEPSGVHIFLYPLG
ncbi:hypothetical protein BKA83DRAFT_4126838 [Pisolithus microcarpus]|nr:hypothetical protein BKA83DRAFT_4126838 [Pisolithus microcarpus]